MAGNMMEHVQCCKCKAPFPTQLWNPEDATALAACPSCGTLQQHFTFPALLQGPKEGVGSERLTDDSEASCFYHASRRAAKSCDHCGRFICGLCEVEIDGRCLCPQCLGSGREQGRIRTIQDERIIYDNIALALCLLPLPTISLAIFGAPASLFVIFRFWKRPLGIMNPRRKWRYILAGMISLLELAAFIAFFVAIYLEFTKN